MYKLYLNCQPYVVQRQRSFWSCHQYGVLVQQGRAWVGAQEPPGCRSSTQKWDPLFTPTVQSKAENTGGVRGWGVGSHTDAWVLLPVWGPGMGVSWSGVRVSGSLEAPVILVHSAVRAFSVLRAGH